MTQLNKVLEYIEKSSTKVDPLSELQKLTLSLGIQTPALLTALKPDADHEEQLERIRRDAKTLFKTRSLFLLYSEVMGEQNPDILAKFLELKSSLKRNLHHLAITRDADIQTLVKSIEFPSLTTERRPKIAASTRNLQTKQITNLETNNSQHAKSYEIPPSLENESSVALTKPTTQFNIQSKFLKTLKSEFSALYDKLAQIISDDLMHAVLWIIENSESRAKDSEPFSIIKKFTAFLVAFNQHYHDDIASFNENTDNSREIIFDKLFEIQCIHDDQSFPFPISYQHAFAIYKFGQDNFNNLVAEMAATKQGTNNSANYIFLLSQVNNGRDPHSIRKEFARKIA